MSNFTVKRPLTLKDLKFANDLPDGSTIVFRNTKGQKKDIFEKLKPTLKVRIIGGLDEVEKPKYNTEKYYARTIYSPLEVYKIIEKIENIEVDIDPTWSDLEKAMYIYNTLCEGMIYDHDERTERSIHTNRCLLGLVTGTAVCAGFSTIYKEMLDRQGIECLYQNRKYEHVWNLIRINGKLIPVDLTWDNEDSEYENNKCGFKYFGRNEYFFEYPSHQVTEEPVLSTSFLTDKEFKKAYNKLFKNKNIEVKTQKYTTKYGVDITYTVIREGKYQRCFISNGKTIKTAIYDDTINLNSILNYNLFTYDNYKFLFTKNIEAKKEMRAKNDKIKLFTRDDGTNFLIQKVRSSMGETTEYKYIDMDNKHLYRYTLYSEEDFLNLQSGYEKGVANILLSRKRVVEKAKKFNGYVGYIGLANGIFTRYVNPVTEEKFTGTKRY